MIDSFIIKSIRTENGLSQQEMANKIGVTRSQFANIELGTSNPSIPVLIKLLQTLDICFEELYGLKKTEKTTQLKQKQINTLNSKIEALTKQLQKL